MGYVDCGKFFEGSIYKLNDLGETVDFYTPKRKKKEKYLEGMCIFGPHQNTIFKVSTTILAVQFQLPVATITMPLRSFTNAPYFNLQISYCLVIICVKCWTTKHTACYFTCVRERKTRGGCQQLSILGTGFCISLILLKSKN